MADQRTRERIDDEQARFAARAGVAVVDQHGVLAIAHQSGLELGQGISQLRKAGGALADFPANIGRSRGGCASACGHGDGEHRPGARTRAANHQVAPTARGIASDRAVGIELGKLPIHKVTVRIRGAGEVEKLVAQSAGDVGEIFITRAGVKRMQHAIVGADKDPFGARLLGGQKCAVAGLTIQRHRLAASVQVVLRIKR